MSRENVELVRRWFAAIAEGDLASELWDADLIVDNIPEFPVVGPYRGYEGLRRWWDDLAEVVEGARVQLDKATRLDDDKVLTIQRLIGDMAYTRIPVDAPWAAIWIVRGGKLCRVSGYATREQALEAVGVREEPMSQQTAELRALAEAAYRALNADDLDGFLALVAEDVEFTSMVAEAEGTTFRGHDGVRYWWETVRGAFQDPRWEVLDVRGSPERGVTTFRMTGTLGGVPVAQTMWQAVRGHDGKATWWGFFRSEAEALEAVGLSE